eukprot:256190-Chlamydomonas_euryale.AAC.5
MAPFARSILQNDRMGACTTSWLVNKKAGRNALAKVTQGTVQKLAPQELQKNGRSTTQTLMFFRAAGWPWFWPVPFCQGVPVGKCDSVEVLRTDKSLPRKWQDGMTSGEAFDGSNGNPDARVSAHICAPRALFDLACVPCLSPVLMGGARLIVTQDRHSSSRSTFEGLCVRIRRWGALKNMPQYRTTTRLQALVSHNVEPDARSYSPTGLSTCMHHAGCPFVYDRRVSLNDRVSSDRRVAHGQMGMPPPGPSGLWLPTPFRQQPHGPNGPSLSLLPPNTDACVHDPAASARQHPTTYLRQPQPQPLPTKSAPPQLSGRLRALSPGRLPLPDLALCHSLLRRALTSHAMGMLVRGRSAAATARGATATPALGVANGSARATFGVRASGAPRCARPRPCCGCSGWSYARARVG